LYHSCPEATYRAGKLAPGRQRLCHSRLGRPKGQSARFVKLAIPPRASSMTALQAIASAAFA
jgi:hypothetical protein